MPQPLPNPENTAAVVVTYHPDTGTRERLEQIRRLVGLLIVIDNNSPQEALAPIREWADQDSGVLLQQMPENVGVASGLNCGVLKALVQEKKFALLFDQDTSPPTDMLGALARHLEKLSEPGREKAGIVAVNYTDGSGRTAFSVSPGLKKTRAAITSGSLLNLVAFEATGRFQDDYFIDEVDHEYCLKLRKNGFDVLLAPDVILRHGLGEMERVNLPGFQPGVSHHGSIRRYYMARNRVRLARAYLTFDPVFVLPRLLLIVYESLLVMLFEKHKAAKLSATLRGIWHGLSGRTGPM